MKSARIQKIFTFLVQCHDNSISLILTECVISLAYTCHIWLTGLNLVNTEMLFLSIQNIDESCCTSFQETIHQGMVHDKLKIEEKSRQFTTYGASSEGIAVEEDSSIGTQLNYYSREKESPIYICKSCGEVFSSYDRLNKHLKISEADQVLYAGNSVVFDCDDHCENDIFFESDKEVSIMGQFEEKQFHPKRLGNLRKLETHPIDVMFVANLLLSYVTSSYKPSYTLVSDHTNDVCDKSFTQLGALKDHLLNHIGKRPHKCKGGLKSQAVTHTTERPHKCDICGKSFGRLGCLKKHALTHTRKRAHKCQICEKSFTRLSILNSHILLHAGKRPHKCDFCANVLPGLVL
ncbi:zinc finger protein 99-like [Schistocerca cancellata]|uniref:zinc finger protein 99-like n=1 Tax=Schistocerca cancellata TaxID=274614 RepID=UPI00211860A5|nr:zinc finger protein 99-like [Schistocerca cancellata]